MPHCPDCLTQLTRKPRPQDGRCRRSQSQLTTRDQRRRARAAARKAETETKLADVYV